MLKFVPLLCCLITLVPSTQCHQRKQYNYIIDNNVAGKALNREAEPYGFFLVKAPRKYRISLYSIRPCIVSSFE